MSPASAMQLAVALPVAASVPIVLTGRSPNLRELVTLVTAAVVLGLVGSTVPDVLAGERPELTLLQLLPGLSLTFRLEPLGMIFALVASFLWLVTSIYSIGYMRGHHEQNQTRFYACFALAIASALGVAFAGNMLTLFVAYEVLSLSTYPLVTHAGTDEAKRAGRLYLGILMGTSIGFMLLAVMWTWHITGSLDFREGGLLAGQIEGPAAAALLALYVFGIGKAAVMPFHRWLPAAMVAPTPVSALLHAVAVVKSGVFAILKICVYLFGLDFLTSTGASDWLLYFAGATILIGSLIAMRQDNLKARLAYSTISQLSYIVAGALLASSLATTGAAMHIAMHAFGKITLFFCAGAILVAAHKTEISQMDGLGRAMPLTFSAFFIGSLSIIGLPPTGGTWSKFYLALGSLEAGQMWILVTLMISSVLNIAYLLPIPIRAFFAVSADSESQAIKEAPLPCLIAIGASTAGCLYLFFDPSVVYELARRIAGGG
ncbi:MAG: monovalent cation/H+ antiporter subunit D family protein [Chromatiales bacterium]|jgi:multicomponent Na+:H+ antiporter subunit D|nr:monovalent cation/H+ antiporter subunit D family protein [Chromatiales bacterium]